MKKLIVVGLVLILCPFIVKGARGCCSRNGGVCGCTSYGITVCCSGKVSDSPNCTCTPPKVYGCTDPDANNYNPNANKDNRSCKYDVYGCTDKKAKNYNSKANKNDDSCEYDVLGCTDSNAINYNYSATKDDGSCKYEILGCTNSKSTNYNKDATKDDGSCDYIKGCTDPRAINYNENAFVDDSTCEYEIVENSEENIENNIINQEDNEIIDEKNTDSYEKEKVIDTTIEKNKGQNDNSDDNDSINPLFPIAVLGGGGYLAFKKIKGKK